MRRISSFVLQAVISSKLQERIRSFRKSFHFHLICIFYLKDRESEAEREVFHLQVSSLNDHNSWNSGVSGYPTWVILRSFPHTLRGIWMGSGPAQTSAHMRRWQSSHCLFAMQKCQLLKFTSTLKQNLVHWKLPRNHRQGNTINYFTPGGQLHMRIRDILKMIYFHIQRKICAIHFILSK